MASLNLEENVNFTRLSRLLVDKGTEALRNTLEFVHPAANLPTVLNAYKTTLLKLKFRVIDDSQWDLLFPPSGDPPDSKTFDITLLTVLLRNICSLLAPATGWNTMPPDVDRSPAVNVTRIKLFRNQIFAHVSSTHVDNTTFENLWQKVSEALVDLKIPQKEINDLKACPLSPSEEVYVQTLKDWVLKDEGCEKTLDSLKTNVKLIQQHLTQSDLIRQKDMQQLSSSVIEEVRHEIQQFSHFSSKHGETKESGVDRKQSSSVDLHLLQGLAKHSFKSKIRSKVKMFHPGTREWLLKHLDDWFSEENKSRLLLITAGPGFGKSVFSAKICELFREKGKLAACHFFDFTDSNLNDPKIMLQSLASQMCENIAGFKEELLDQLKRPHKVNSLKDAFQIYFQNPLDELEAEPTLIVIDGLDECATDHKSDMLKLVTDHFPDLPKCVKVLVTSRQEVSLQPLRQIQRIDIDEKNEENRSDVLEYLKVCLPSLSTTCGPRVLRAIVANSSGSFLYAFHAQDELCKRNDLRTINFRDITFFLPKGLGSMYKDYFHRLEMELKAIIKKDPKLLTLLELIVVASGSLPLKFVARALGLGLDCRDTKKVIEKVNAAVSCLFYVSNDVVTVFHKSVYDWLLASGDDDHEYAVKIGDGKRQLWLLCEEIFEEIKGHVMAGKNLNLTSELKYALEYGHLYLERCKMKDSFHWLVDMIIVHVILTCHPRSTDILCMVWESVLRHDETLSLQLRQRISWHLIEIRSMDEELMQPTFSYLEIVLNHSPKDCFTDDERKIAKWILEKRSCYTKRCSVERRSLMLLLAKFFSSPITAVGVSSNKKSAAVALNDGTICILSLPDLVVLFQFSTGCEHISSCIFSPEDSLVLYGKLETALSIAEKKAVPFFWCKAESFKSCSFSPNGKKLVTSNGSTTLKLWDVGGQSLLAVLCADVPLNCCSFDKTGVLIIGDMKSSMEDSYCVWNAITFQRVDLRKSSFGRDNKNGFRKSKRCNRCFNQVDQELIPCKVLGNSNGMYNDVECIFYVNEEYLRVVESVHFTTIAAWGLFLEGRRLSRFLDIIAIEDHLWLHVENGKLIVFISDPPKKNQSCLSLVLWCSFTSDGTRLATCTSEGFIQLWNVDTCLIYQRFRDNLGTSSAACWWSDKHLFVCRMHEGIPSLSRYPVDQNFTIVISQVVLMLPFPVEERFLPFSQILDFSEGYLSFECGKRKPVIVFNVVETEVPRILLLPDIRPMMGITVSSNASFVLGTGHGCFLLWKRTEADPLRYDILYGFEISDLCYVSESCFNSDSTYAVSFLPERETFVVIDVDRRSCKASFINDRFIPSNHCMPAKLFCTNRLLILVTSKLIEFFELTGHKRLGRFFQRYYPANSICHAKLSPKGTILAIPTLNGDVDFFVIRHPT